MVRKVFFKKGELKLLWPFYLDALFSPILWFMPIFAIVYFRDLGFTVFQISLLMMALPLCMLLFEIPTGAIADIYGRKFSVLIGALIQGLAVLSILFLQNFWAILLAFAMVGFGGTFDSGAREAWVTDMLKGKRKDFLHEYFVKVRSLDSFAIIFSGFLGVFLVKLYGLSVIWPVAASSFLVTILLLSFADENFAFMKAKNHAHNTVGKSVMFETLRESIKVLIKQSKTSLRYAKNHHILYYFLIATSIFVFASVFNGELAWITFFQELNLPNHAFGYLWSAMGAVGIFAPLVSLKFLKKGKEKKFIIIAFILGIAVLLPIIFVKTIFFAFVVGLSSLFFTGMSSPVERIYFHKFVKSKLRATIGSVESMLIGLVGIFSLPLVGLSIDYIGARHTILISAFLMAIATAVFFRIDENKGKRA